MKLNIWEYYIGKLANTRNINTLDTHFAKNTNQQSTMHPNHNQVTQTLQCEQNYTKKKSRGF